MGKLPFSNFHYGPLAFLLAITGGFALAEMAPEFVRSVQAGVDEIQNGDEPKPIDMSQFVRIDDEHFRITANENVDMEPFASVTVRKVGYGNETDVRIAYTSTGTYSTDGFASPNVSYPGIKVEKVFPLVPGIQSGSMIYFTKSELHHRRISLMHSPSSIVRYYQTMAK
ncbi:hypothetical protein MXMO3_02700 [Maritalea myrionectae]|uniref:Uncharacterized protein n=1 Tax=Maritalea myrionectae TaxID=454601 RepID=A0A2R4MGN6_9HYPH|nr:hypothetical protein [Maritalea myrionectae]AVX05211.1 hypothetical protein MXMO3_02700 [Maritalea myrionectae]